jgi:hypothetical protein
LEISKLSDLVRVLKIIFEGLKKIEWIEGIEED